MTQLVALLLVSQAGAQALTQSEVPDALASRAVSPRFEHLRLEDGLSQGSIHDIFQDSRGFMWFTTQDGLNRFDGHEVKSFTHEPFNEESLGEGFSLGIDEDHDGAIWVATAGGGLNRLDPLTNKITVYRHDPDDPSSISTNDVWAVTVDSEGRLWVGTTRGLSVMDPANPGVFERFLHDPDDEFSLCDNVVHRIYEDSSGRMWIASRNGICMTDRERPGRFESRLLDGPRPRPPGGFGEYDFEAYDILERPEEPGVFWVGTARGLVRVKVETGESERFLFDPDYSGGNRRQNLVWRLTQDPVNPSIIWAPTMGAGLARFDVRAKRFVMYRSDDSNPNGLPEDAVISVYTDRSGVVWAGSQVSGVSRFNPASVSFAHYRAGRRENPLSLPGETVWGIFETRDGILWVGTQDLANQSRLSAIDRDNGVSKHFEHRANDPSSRDPGLVMPIYEDASGNLWVGSDRGVDLLDRSTGTFRHFRTGPEDQDAIPGQATWIMEDRGGNLWFATTAGLARMRKDQVGRFDRFVHDPNNPETLPRGGVDHVIEDLAGFIWVATGNGVARLDPETGRATRYEHDRDDRSTLGGRLANFVHERAREAGVIWVGLSGGGMDRLDTRTGEIRHFTERDGLANNTVYGLLEDDLGRFWITTNHGLSRFDPDTEEFKNFGLEIGLQGLEFAERALHKCRHGEFFIGGTNGMNAFFPNEISDNLNAPEVRLVDLKLFNESVTTSGALNLAAPISETEMVELDYSQREVTFDFVAFHYADPTGNEYAYMLEGFNDDWVHVGGQRTASFTNLSPGEYTFRVKAANSDGVWNEEGASVRLVVNPPFWMTWWFRILGFAVFAGLIFGAYRLRTAQLATRARELEGQVDKRTRELTASNAQLEQSANIVEAINQETSFRRLLTKILEEGRVIPGVEKATALVYMQDEGLFRVRASSGWEVDAMQGIGLTQRQARERYVDQAEEVAEDIFVEKDVAGRAGSEEMAEFGAVASFLVLRVRVEDDVAGYLVFDNLHDPDAFDQRDVELLERLRKHIQSAFIKTRILEDLQSTLADLQTTQDRLVQSEKMASLGQLTAGIAHEIRNPLNFVNNFSDLTVEMVAELEEEVESHRTELPERLVEDLSDIIQNLKLNADKILEHGKRADGIVHSMLQHSSGGEGQLQDVAVNALVEEYLNLAYHGARARDPEFNVTLERDYDDSVVRVEGIPQDLGRVFLNLIGNAFDAIRELGPEEFGPDGPTVKVSTFRSGNHVEIRIADNGPGIPEDVRARIFEPFYTTKPTGKGTGLGLSMSYDIVTKGHGGTLEVDSAPGEGATFIVRLPG